jgi:tRNA modification GTPase
MNPLEYTDTGPIVALATPWAESAVAVIRTSGAGTLDLLAGCFSRPGALKSAFSHRMVHGTLTDPATGEAADEVLCAVFREGRGYTGEEAAEIYAHGSLPGISLILDILRRRGFRDAAPGEFTLRAFLNGRLDLTQAEAVAEIVASRSRTAHSMALHRLSGGIRELVEGYKSSLTALLAAVEIQLDYAEDEVEAPRKLDTEEVAAIRRGLEALASTFETGRLYRDGARIALSGRTNAGKSSLFNLFVREDRSIVSEVHGTTRDFVHEEITVKGIPATLYDTAGLRAAGTESGEGNDDGKDDIETEGIRRSGLVTGEADLVLYLVDGIRGIDGDELESLDGERSILIWSKADSAGAAPAGFLPVSAFSTEGFALLEEEIARRLEDRGGASDGAVIDSARQRDLLNRSAGALGELLRGAEEEMPLDVLAVDLKEALDALGEITGEVTTAEVLHEMFSRFCVGK